MIDISYMRLLGEEIGVCLDDKMLSQLDLYAELLVEANSKMNLTTITDPIEIAVKHFADSLRLLPFVKGKSLIDVGTGAGFPSLPCKLADPDISLTMLDCLQKRVGFLQQVCDATGIEASCVHARAEDYALLHREQFDVATARAVAHMRELAEFCLPFVKVGGSFIALKGPELDIELDEAKPAIKLLGGQIEKVLKYEIADGSGRSMVIIKKLSQTPTKFPRSFAKIKKQPIK